MIPFLDRQTILEIGHGPGHLLCKLGDLGKKVYGLDLSLPMSRQARQRLDKLSQPVRLVNASVFEIPIKSDSFDHVVATFPTEYIYDLRTYSEIHRVLKTGGTLVILPLAWFTGKKFLERMAAILFHITGQAPQWEESALTPFSHLGFTLTSHWIKLDSSKLVIVIAQKNEDDWVG